MTAAALRASETLLSDLDHSRVTLLVNPAAGGFRPGTIDRLIVALHQRGLAVDLKTSEAPGHLADLAAEAATDVVAVAGGDGSVNEVVSALLAREGVRPALAVIPQGTANVLAYEIALPSDPNRLADVILRGRRAELSLGLANGRPFFLMASAGLDAEIVHAVETGPKPRVKKLAFVHNALALTLKGRGTPLTVEADGRRHEVKLAVVANARHYGGPFVLARDTSATAPGLVLVALRDDSPWKLMRAAAALAAGRIGPSANIIVEPVREVTIRSAEPVATQIDGEALGATPLEVTTADRTLDVLVP